MCWFSLIIRWAKNCANNWKKSQILKDLVCIRYNFSHDEFIPNQIHTAKIYSRILHRIRNKNILTTSMSESRQIFEKRRTSIRTRFLQYLSIIRGTYENMYNIYAAKIAHVSQKNLYTYILNIPARLYNAKVFENGGSWGKALEISRKSWEFVEDFSFWQFFFNTFRYKYVFNEANFRSVC